jgi:putative FmdB family regulatory protein
MPLFHYLCQKCEEQSEILVRGEAAPTCPKCGSPKLVKQASRFNAVNGEVKRETRPAPCGMPACCGGGACGLN